MTRTRFTVMIKHVIKNAINYSNQKIIIAKINIQNLRIHNIIKIPHVEYSKRGAQDSTKAGTLIIDVIIS